VELGPAQKAWYVYSAQEQGLAAGLIDFLQIDNIIFGKLDPTKRQSD